MDSSFCVAVHALVYLNHKACMLSSEDLAENICTNPARVRRVMSALKKAGMVHTKEGSVGGYRFAGDPEQLTLDLVADALGARFVDSSWHSGDADMECLVASGMADLMDELFLDLNTRCKERLAQVSIADLDHRIFCTDRQKNAERSMV
ncbi:Rrf2 family transcriptional regulator [Oscillibacter sp. MSJ-2]|uniref:Rrf2 family transcriptional regulator n=1 Tax=Dysosmobacter acutus TaxID=2841504 RepID=A0ABS6F9C5_9FIRM|nr:Rrf2 family transcriptional regulator [Dysosmobacter acutus]MBU5626898.1 Rrf2 family transcriptional regulator [Dysosmobacter acutus]